MYGKITGTGSALPKKIVTNEELSLRLDTSDEWIRSRTGIAQRRVCEEEDVFSLSLEASSKALADSGGDEKNLDLIIAATMSYQEVMPSLACRLQAALGADRAAAFDLNGACTGFVHALAAGQAYIGGGLAKRVLVVGAEQMSSIIDWSDRSTCVLFGDGAGAVVLEEDRDAKFSYAGKSYGEKGQALSYGEATDHVIKMDGRSVFAFAVREVPLLIRKLAVQTGFDLSEIDHYLLHQANERMIEKVAQRIEVSKDRFPVNLQNYGNTSAASIPILLDEQKKQGKLATGDQIVMAGFGGGLGAAAVWMNWMQ